MSSAVVLLDVAGCQVTLFSIVFGFIWLVYVWETYLKIRQRKTISRSRNVPSDIKEIMDNESFQKSRIYALDKGLFSLVCDVYHMLQLSIILYFSLIPWLWYKVLSHSVILNEYFVDKFGINLHLGPDSEIRCSMLFFLYSSLFSFVDSLPWSIYSTFVIEARHGFNKQTFGFFLKDEIKGLIISLIVGMPIVCGLIWIIKVGGQYFYLYASLFTLVVCIFMMFIYPEFIAPLFDRYEPLPDGPLKAKIEALADKIHFPLKKLLVVEGSKRSSHSNAYFYGFGKNKRIVLYDTLIRGFEFPAKAGSSPAPEDASKPQTEHGCAVDEEIVAVLAHELGHWKLGHTIMNLVIAQMNILLMFCLFGMLMDLDYVFTSFGFGTDTPIMLRLIIIFKFIFSPYHTVFTFLMFVLSRKFEFQADNFAVKLGYRNYLKSALVILQKDNLSFPICDWLYSMFNYSHPPLLERLAALYSAKEE